MRRWVIIIIYWVQRTYVSKRNASVCKHVVISEALIVALIYMKRPLRGGNQLLPNESIYLGQKNFSPCRWFMAPSCSCSRTYWAAFFLIFSPVLTLESIFFTSVLQWPLFPPPYLPIECIIIISITLLHTHLHTYITALDEWVSEWVGW